MVSQPSDRQKVLFVDDNRLVCAAYRRQLSSRVDVVTAADAKEALQLVDERSAFAAVFADLQMPGMDGLTLLGRVRQLHPQTVRILFTGKADLKTAQRAVNEVEVFRILLKPCTPALLWESVEAALNRFEAGSTGGVETGSQKIASLLLAIIAKSNPPLNTRAARLRRYVKHVCTSLHVSDTERFELAAGLSCLGQVGFDHSMLTRFVLGRPADATERALFQGQWATSAELLAVAPSLRDIAEMLAGAVVSVSCGVEDPSLMPPIVLGAQLLQVATALDSHLMAGTSRDAALAVMRTQLNVLPRILDGLMDLPFVTRQPEVRERRVADIEVGMTLEEPVRAVSGLLLAPAGRVITPALRQVLMGYVRTVGVVEPILVRTAANK